MINTFALLIPVFLLIALFEWYILFKKGDKKYTAGRLVMNMSIGAIDQICSLAYFALLYFALSYVYTHFRIIEIKSLWYQWVLAYIAVDFLSYWYHRISHRVNILWAGHVTHHSSEVFNFSNGFRTSPFQGLNRIVFWSLLPIFGFSPTVLLIILKVSGLYDFMLHNEYVPKLRVIEKIFITPSLHRVHHGKNDLYIDKNYGSTFSIWDRIFGTYQEETEVVKYGISGSYVDNSPFWAIGHYYHYLWKTMNATSRWTNKVKLIFMPPAWTPDDVTDRQSPLSKSKIPVTIHLKYYAGFQMSFFTAWIILLLIYQDFFSNWEFIICAFVGIVNLSKAAMIFNGNIYENLEKRESMWLGFEAILVLLFLFQYSNFYFLYLLTFLLISLILIRSKPTSPLVKIE
jgi:sterol desaturase/sphingolipid hydroxylase (fatty acid hydroxylase superfamily)